MTKICYTNYNPRSTARTIIELCNNVIVEYQAEGFDLTLRQLYYQLVARGYIENSQKSYSRLGQIVNRARLGGLMDWESIVDRTRFVSKRNHWEYPHEILHSAWKSYFLDMWKDQQVRPEVWIEKDALSGVISGICNELDTPYFSCRGYVSQSAMWRAALGVRKTLSGGQSALIIHLGDHDPSGIDMTRDIEDRIELLSDYAQFEIDRIALNMDQIEEYQPPPNPAKSTDSRYGLYIDKYGHDSWELDALDPRTIVDLIKRRIEREIDRSYWNQQKVKLESEKKYLEEVYQAANNEAG